jgi:hypothetical protein
MHADQRGRLLGSTSMPTPVRRSGARASECRSADACGTTRKGCMPEPDGIEAGATPDNVTRPADPRRHADERGSARRSADAVLIIQPRDATRLREDRVRRACDERPPGEPRRPAASPTRRAVSRSNPRASPFSADCLWSGNAVGRWTAAARHASPPDATTAGSAIFSDPRVSASLRGWPAARERRRPGEPRQATGLHPARRPATVSLSRIGGNTFLRRGARGDCRQSWKRRKSIESGQTGRPDGAWRGRPTPVS